MNIPMARFARTAICALVLWFAPYGEAQTLSLSDVQPSAVGKTGQTTLKTTGTGFTSSTAFKVTDAAGAERTAQNVLVLDETTALVTFQLAGAQSGNAIIKALHGAEQSSLQGKLELEPGLEGKLSVFLDAPTTLQAGQTTTLSVQYANEGGLDVPLPLLVLNLPGASYIGLSPGANNLGESAFLLGIPAHPVYNTLRPGEAASTSLYVTAGAAASPTLKAVSPADPALAGVALSLSGELQAEYGANLGQFYQRALGKLEQIVAGLPVTKYKSVKNVDGRWILEQPEASPGMPRPLVTGKPYLLPIASAPAAPAGTSAGAGDGNSKLWVLIITDEEYGPLPLSTWFDPALFPGGTPDFTLAVPGLPGATVDGQRVYDLFRYTYGLPQSQITWLSDKPGDATTLSSAVVGAAFAALKTKVDGDDKIAVWFSGHAMPPDSAAKRPAGSWLLHAGDAYTAADLSAALTDINAGTAYVYVETPFSDAFADQLTTARTAAFAAAQAGEATYDTTSGGGLFTTAMTASLGGGAGVLDAFTDSAEVIKGKGGMQHPGNNAPTAGFSGIDLGVVFSQLFVEVLQGVSDSLQNVNSGSLNTLASAAAEIGLETGIPTPASYTPGGFAVCPWSRVAYVTDNTNGRLLMVNPYEPRHRLITLLTDLGTPGDVDVACAGRSLVYSTGQGVREVLFGFTVHVRDKDHLPLAGANVLVESELGQLQKRTDQDGYLTVMNVLDPALDNRKVSLTVESGGKKELYSFTLNPSCQTFYTLRFTGTGGVSEPERPLGPVARYTPPKGTCKAEEWGWIDNPTPQKLEIPQVPGITSYIKKIPGSRGGPTQAYPCSIVIVTPADGLETNVKNQVVTGWVSDGSVENVEIELNGAETTASALNGTFMQEVALAAGTNTLIARGTCSNGTRVQSEPVTVKYNAALGSAKSAVAGCIADENDGLPVSGVKVLELTSGLQTTTDRNGCFSFIGLSAAKATLKIEY